MPKVMSALSVIGLVAMLWVGGHILLTGADTLGWHAPYELVHRLADPAHAVPGVGGLLAWLVDTLASAIVGVLVGLVAVGLMRLLPFGRHDPHEQG